MTITVDLDNGYSEAFQTMREAAVRRRAGHGPGRADRGPVVSARRPPEGYRLPTPPKCQCHCAGSWDHPVFGVTGPTRESVAWAGCPSCDGRAVGSPIPSWLLLAVKAREAKIAEVV